MIAAQPICPANHTAPCDVENEKEQTRNGFATVTVMDRASNGWYRHKRVVPHVHLTVGKQKA